MAPVIRLTTSYDICASHQLARSDWSDEQNARAFGHCSRLHGHQYKLEITLIGDLPDDTGMLVNGYEVDRIVGKKIISKLDHRHLNADVDFFKEHLPTAEWIAVWVYGELQNAFPSRCRVEKVRIYETPSLYAEYGADL